MPVLSHTTRTVLALVAMGATQLPGQALDSITPEVMRAHITRLADDSMRGRATPSRQLEQAARYAAAAFRLAGLVPLGDSGTYLQRYQILRTRLVPESSSVEMLGPTTAHWQVARDVDWLRGSELA